MVLYFEEVLLVILFLFVFRLMFISMLWFGFRAIICVLIRGFRVVGLCCLIFGLFSEDAILRF